MTHFVRLPRPGLGCTLLLSCGAAEAERTAAERRRQRRQQQAAPQGRQAGPEGAPPGRVARSARGLLRRRRAGRGERPSEEEGEGGEGKARSARRRRRRRGREGGGGRGRGGGGRGPPRGPDPLFLALCRRRTAPLHPLPWSKEEEGQVQRQGKRKPGAQRISRRSTSGRARCEWCLLLLVPVLLLLLLRVRPAPASPPRSSGRATTTAGRSPRGQTRSRGRI